MFLAINVLLRVAPKRRTGSLSPNDMIILVLIGALVRDATMGGSTSIADILAMIAVIVGWGYIFDFMEYRFPALGRMLREPEAPLIRDGQVIHQSMRRELISEQELMAALREQGIEDLIDVRSACLEADGQISIIKRNGNQ
jgi:uncharacterized membrane protein YcaP (DUF421 family)